MNSLFRRYLSVHLMLRIFAGFLLGSAIGITLWVITVRTGIPVTVKVLPWISPFGNVFVSMLKMVVIPVIFFSLLSGAASLPLSRFGRIGTKVIAWYFFCSLLAACVGAGLALVVNPGSGTDLGDWKTMADTAGAQAQAVESSASTGNAFEKLLLSMFQNPFEALATGSFLSIIVFAVLLGLSIRALLESGEEASESEKLHRLIDLINALRDAIFKLVDWILEYSPVGVLALTIVNFGMYGPSIAGPYVRVALGVIVGILGMVLLVYPLLLAITTRRNPFQIMKGMREAMLTAFITRSSAATLPVSLRVMEEDLGVRNELASFSLPLGATINMDGVCVHLPMFAVLAANMFGLPMSGGGLVVLVITTVLASVGAGGVPGGSLMLLFIILEAMGLSPDQIAVVVALALGINPILDMFETANNVTGDMVCTYAVAAKEGLVDDEA